MGPVVTGKRRVEGRIEGVMKESGRKGVREERKTLEKRKGEGGRKGGRGREGRERWKAAKREKGGRKAWAKVEVMEDGRDRWKAGKREGRERGRRVERIKQ